VAQIWGVAQLGRVDSIHVVAWIKPLKYLVAPKLQKSPPCRRTVLCSGKGEMYITLPNHASSAKTEIPTRLQVSFLQTTNSYLAVHRAFIQQFSPASILLG
jgi:hypothetical protein